MLNPDRLDRAYYGEDMVSVPVASSYIATLQLHKELEEHMVWHPSKHHSAIHTAVVTEQGALHP